MSRDDVMGAAWQAPGRWVKKGSKKDKPSDCFSQNYYIKKHSVIPLIYNTVQKKKTKTTTL